MKRFWFIYTALNSLICNFKIKINFIVFTLSLFIPLQLFAQTASTRFERIRPTLFQVKTISPGQQEKRSYGTGFVVDKEGLIATNFHVVADHIWKPKKYKIVIDNKGQNVDAQVVALDIVNDLALIKVDMKFSTALKIVPGASRQGQEAFSYGLPEDLDWTVVRGVYNSILEQGPYRLVHLSTPLNHGMSGGPTTNAAGEVIGINSAGRMRAQDISFAVPAEYLVNLIREYKTKPQTDFLETIEDQAVELQNKMTQILLKGFDNKKKFNSILLPKFDKSLRCWGDSAGGDIESSPILKNKETCVVENSLFIDGERSFGTLHLEFQLDENKKLNPLAWAHYRAQSFSNTNQFVHFFVKDSVINFNREKCMRQTVMKTPEDKIVIATCVQKISPFKDLYDTYIFFQSEVNEKNSIRVQLMLSGFNQKNIQSLTKSLLNYKFTKEP